QHGAVPILEQLRVRGVASAVRKEELLEEGVAGDEGIVEAILAVEPLPASTRQAERGPDVRIDAMVDAQVVEREVRAGRAAFVEEECIAAGQGDPEQADRPESEAPRQWLEGGPPADPSRARLIDAGNGLVIGVGGGIHRSVVLGLARRRPVELRGVPSSEQSPN